MIRCVGCMREYGPEYEICPFCGFIKDSEPDEIHMIPGTILEDRYYVGKVLGFGGFGATYVAWDEKLEQKVAIKEYLPGEFSTRMPGHTEVSVFGGEKQEQFEDGIVKFLDEARKLAKFQQEEGIVRVFDSFKENNTAYIVMEYLEGETLASRLEREQKIPEEEAVGIIMPIMKSLEAVHKEGILHRDIAPDNIFLPQNGEAKLIDFGAARYATTSYSRSLTVIIKQGYSPEEQYRSSHDQGPYTDVYALGGCLYKMLTGVTPPDAMERRSLLETKKKDMLVAPHKLNSKISLVTENAILNAMNVRIEDRTPDVRSFMEELKSDTPVKRKKGHVKKLDIYGWPKWLKVSVITIVAALLTVCVLALTGVIETGKGTSQANLEVPEGMHIIPDVEGKENYIASSILEEQTFKMLIDGSISSDYVKAGNIVMQEPASGSFAEDYSTVHLYLSKGDGKIIEPKNGIATMPYVIGTREGEAKADLRKAGFSKPKIEYCLSNDYEKGLVISQTPEFGTVLEENGEVEIMVSLGSEYVEVPDVIGMKMTDARTTCFDADLDVLIEYVVSDMDIETVCTLSAEPGESIKRNDTIVLYVSESFERIVELEKIHLGRSYGVAKTSIEIDTDIMYTDTIPMRDDIEIGYNCELIVKEGVKIKTNGHRIILDEGSKLNCNLSKVFGTSDYSRIVTGKGSILDGDKLIHLK